MNIVLCGMMGSGKTTIGIRLADLTGLRWYDTDDLITEKYGKISDIFEFYGEERFREMETEMVKRVAEEDGAVISTGGGCVLRTENCVLLKEKGKIVYLKVPIETLFSRAGHAGEERPLLKNATFNKMKELLERRTPIYEGCADYTVNTDGKDVDEIAREICTALGVTVKE